ncbi:bicyclomycin resistance protein [Thalassobacillus devorans]|uniref:Bicyclomycin resistance protein n=1 Tax=Thalassobacillus devorans TaxID=279813 RepID=A0ABQ1NIZ7_9BACI|nr:sugar ABC transporter permease [Thalassobacillus devorans]NIK27255.1 multiple sugar transport system permease protein [Thalassobacillus devorans]GGC76204.1 bicyclomycin resistance protein [Thalassobacillus devorans]
MSNFQSVKSPKIKPGKRAFVNSPFPWLLPLGLILTFVFVYPIFEIIRLSFTDASLLGADYSYTTESYGRLFGHSEFFSMLLITAIFVSFSVVFQLFFGFIIAFLIDQGQKLDLKGTVIVRTSVLTAWAIPGVIIGIIWRVMYTETEVGIFNSLVGMVGMDLIPFLSDPTIALISVIVANVWRGTAFSMILIYAAIQTLPNDVMEAAKIDGANGLQRLFKVMLPMLAPIILVTLIIISIDTFNTFDMVMALTGGGPGQSTEVIALSIYTTIFREFNLGQGAATSVVLLSINVIMTLVYLKILGRQGEK